jgi:hypothetical protein
MVASDSIAEGMLVHIRQLSEVIGPRGSTTPGERAGAEYCQAEFKKMGLEGKLDPYASAVSIFHPHLIASLVLLAAFIIYPLAGRWLAVPAAILSVVALTSDLLELSFIPNPLRWITRKGMSQNVHAVIPSIPKEPR